MPKPQKPQQKPQPHVEPLKAERIQRIQQQLDGRPHLLLSGIQVAVGPMTLFLIREDSKSLTREDLEFAAALAKAA